MTPAAADNAARPSARVVTMLAALTASRRHAADSMTRRRVPGLARCPGVHGAHEHVVERLNVRACGHALLDEAGDLPIARPAPASPRSRSIAASPARQAATARRVSAPSSGASHITMPAAARIGAAARAVDRPMARRTTSARHRRRTLRSSRRSGSWKVTRVLLRLCNQCSNQQCQAVLCSGGTRFAGPGSRQLARLFAAIGAPWPRTPRCPSGRARFRACRH